MSTNLIKLLVLIFVQYRIMNKDLGESRVENFKSWVTIRSGQEICCPLVWLSPGISSHSFGSGACIFPSEQGDLHAAPSMGFQPLGLEICCLTHQARILFRLKNYNLSETLREALCNGATPPVPPSPKMTASIQESFLLDHWWGRVSPKPGNITRGQELTTRRNQPALAGKVNTGHIKSRLLAASD